LIVGTSPGKEEDEVGQPYIGDAGNKLRYALADLGIEPSEVYITTMVCCRPPEGRDPVQEEVEVCRERLNRLINILDPEAIILLGKLPSQLLLRIPAPLMKTHGTFFRLRVPGELGDYEVPVLLTFEPAGLLRRGDSSEHGLETLWIQDLRKAFALTKE